MNEPISSYGIAWLIKYYGWKLIAGVIAVSLSFLVFWPKTQKEGVARIAATILGSTIFGESAVEVVKHYVSWFPLETVGQQMPVFVLAGLPAWWILGALVRWFNKKSKKDIDTWTR